jgi:hypothetical protein
VVVDSHPDRLARIGYSSLTFERFRCGTGTGPKAWVLIRVACVGYQCCDKHGTEHSITMNELVQAVKATGSIGVVGVLFPKILKEELQKRTHGF